MDSSRSINCLIRNRPVAHTPEEEVRQRLLEKMVGELGFPKGLIVVEKGIGFRRFDIVCYSQEMSPLLLIECKAEKIDEGAIRQAMGYNETIRAPFICLASHLEIKTIWVEKGSVISVPFLPFYREMKAASKGKK